jgi:hypothetical protein
VDENGVPLKYKAQYQESNMSVSRLYKRYGYGVVFIISKTRLEPIKTPSGVIGYEYVTPVQAAIVDKWSTDGTVSVNGQKLVWAAEQEILRVLRENMLGSLRIVQDDSVSFERMSPTILYTVTVGVVYSQYASAYGDYTVANRRFYAVVKEWRVGVNASPGNYGCVGHSSGIGPAEWDVWTDPFVEIPIPCGIPVIQEIGGSLPRGKLQVKDYEAVTNLLRTIDVHAEAGTQKAVTDTGGRTIIGYYAIVVYNTRISNVSDGRTVDQSVFSFSNTQITSIRRRFDLPGSPTEVEWVYELETQTDV